MYKSIEAITEGSFLCDMHDGFNPRLQGEYKITQEIRIRTNEGAKLLQGTIRFETGRQSYTYTNKYLIVIDIFLHRDGSATLRCGYSYDGLSLTLLDIKWKPEEEANA